MDKKDLLTDEELILKQTFETATFTRRTMSFILDTLIIIALTYLAIVVFKLFQDLDKFFELFEATQNDIENRELYLEMVDLFWKLMLNIYLTWIVTILIYYTLVPAIIGKGRTLGKLLAGIGTVDLNTLDEVSPSKLILREFVGRVLIEYILIIPLFVSIIISFIREDSRSIHDLIANTVVIRFDLYDMKSM